MEMHLLESIVCPVCFGQLEYDKSKQQLICQQDKLAYPIRDNIPVLLASEAVKLPESEVEQ
jgi:uncharacterized protein